MYFYITNFKFIIIYWPYWISRCIDLSTLGVFNSESKVTGKYSFKIRLYGLESFCIVIKCIRNNKS